MEIRQANPSDLESIIAVLRASLGEDMELSERVWNFKHKNNPFGTSIILVAEEDGQICGVRAFMRWDWQFKDKVFSGLRAVDTATHPDFRGRGIFTKLTTRALELARENDFHFVFNTPNDQSRPGYLKMGWEVVAPLQVALHLNLSGFFNKNSQQLQYKHFMQADRSKVNLLCENWNSYFSKKNQMFTPKSAEQLKWRYEENPLQAYEIYTDNEIYIAAYLKKRGKYLELRIAECVLLTQNQTLTKVLKEWKKKFAPHFISFSPKVNQDLIKLAVKGKFGPKLTLRKLTLSSKNYDCFLNLNNWTYSLGDLELF